MNKPSIATNRPCAQPIDISLDDHTCGRIRVVARNIVLARTPCLSLRQYLSTASERGLDRLCGLVSNQLSGNQVLDPTDVRAVLLQKR